MNISIKELGTHIENIYPEFRQEIFRFSKWNRKSAGPDLIEIQYIVHNLYNLYYSAKIITFPSSIRAFGRFCFSCKEYSCEPKLFPHSESLLCYKCGTKYDLDIFLSYLKKQYNFPNASISTAEALYFKVFHKLNNLDHSMLYYSILDLAKNLQYEPNN